MVALENIKHRITNIPRYLRYTMKKNKPAPFHWTATQKNIEQKRKSFENQIRFREGESEKKVRIDKLCERLAAKPKLSANDKIFYKEYCLSEENVNVGEVNINALNLESENLNLPLKDPLAGAIQRLNSVGDVLTELNQIVEDTSQLNFILNQKKVYQKQEKYLQGKIEEARRLLQEARDIAEPVSKPAARSLLAYINEVEQSLDTLYEEMNRVVEYDIDKARRNIAKAIPKIRSNKIVNISNALEKLRGSPSMFNLNLLQTYGEALEEQIKRRERQARVALAKSPVGNWRGGKTRRNRKH
jgi:uncharacterized protein YoxC